MKRYVKKEVVSHRDILDYILCDTCNENITESGGECYYSVETGHNLWGNDSYESTKEYDFCTYDCLKSHMDFYFKTAQHAYEYEITKELNRI